MLDRDMRRLFGTGDFEHVDYRIVQEGDQRILEIDAVEKAWGPELPALRHGFSSDFKGDGLFNIAASYRRTWLNSLGAEWRTDLRFGHNSRLRTGWYQPLATTHYLFVEPYAEARRVALDIYRDDLRLATYNMDRLRFGVDIGTQVTKFGEARLGLAGGTLRPKLESGPELLDLGAPRIDQAGRQPAPRVRPDRQHQLPALGRAASTEIFASRRDLGARDNYTRLDLFAQGAMRFGDSTFALGLRGAGTLDHDLPPYDLVQWGGFLRQSGHPVELAGRPEAGVRPPRLHLQAGRPEDVRRRLCRLLGRRRADGEGACSRSRQRLRRLGCDLPRRRQPARALLPGLGPILRRGEQRLRIPRPPLRNLPPDG